MARIESTFNVSSADATVLGRINSVGRTCNKRVIYQELDMKVELA